MLDGVIVEDFIQMNVYSLGSRRIFAPFLKQNKNEYQAEFFTHE